MTDVIVLKNIAGHRAGEIAKLDARLQKHVDAGNARILADAPAEAEPEPEKWPPPSAVPEPAPWAIESGDEDTSEED